MIFHLFLKNVNLASFLYASNKSKVTNIRNIKFLLFFCILLGILTTSCSDDYHYIDDNYQAIKNIKENETELLTQEAINYKNSFLQLRQNKKSRSTNLALTNTEIETLRAESLNMLKSYGFESDEFKEFMQEGDPRIILLGAIYVSIMETNQAQPFNLIKSRSESEDTIGETCLVVAKVARCIALALRDLVTIEGVKALLSGCVTKEAAKVALKTLLKKVPWISTVWALDTFADCMGWYDSIS